MDTSNLIGLVLCGGQSERMGSDKGLLTALGETPWIVRQVARLMECNISVFVSLRTQQFESYGPFVDYVRFIPDTVRVKGPLAGLLSAHQKKKNADILVLACDMISVNTIVLDQLIATYNSSSEVEVFLFENKGQMEPLCAIYTAKALQKILLMYVQNRLTTFSIKKILIDLDCKRISTANAYNFQNYNSPTDLHIEARP